MHYADATAGTRTARSATTTPRQGPVHSALVRLHSIPSDLGYLPRTPQERQAAGRARLLTRGFEGGGIRRHDLHRLFIGYADELMTEEAKGLGRTLAKGNYLLNDVCGPETRDTIPILVTTS